MITGWPGSWTWPRVLFPCLWSQQQFAPQHFGRSAVWDFRFNQSAGFHVMSRFGLRFSQRSRQQTLRSTMFSPATTLKILALSCIESWKIRDIGQRSQMECCPKKRAPTTSHAFVHCNPHFSLTHVSHHLAATSKATLRVWQFQLWCNYEISLETIAPAAPRTFYSRCGNQKVWNLHRFQGNPFLKKS